ncbi:hypothetical protein ruthe_02957 [Rubellimicrobium thermophilum DSM 16684]|uniref:Uncharacterized protein n=2 Tax=Rubellimicrobium TaxID=295418 RepID=S9QPF7_9RHOB|nr:hypothetical protein ruthe_02957 [Rubellimicrobium thermophilum DSM 16684]
MPGRGRALAGMVAYLRNCGPSQPVPTCPDALQMPPRFVVFFSLPLLLAACAASPGLNVGALMNPAEAQRRGAVELAVKTAFPGILNEIAAGGGPSLTAAMDAAGVPPGDRAARILQLQGDISLYGSNPAALAAALLLYGR